MTRPCVTHYHACDCREAMFKELRAKYDALIEAMNIEYTQAKHMKGKRQLEWITAYSMLHRIKSLAMQLEKTP